MEKEILQLEKRVKNLQLWKEGITKERFKFPLDYGTTEIIKKSNIVFTGRTFVTNGVQLSDLVGFGLIMGTSSNKDKKVAVATFPLKGFSVNTTSNAITSNDGNNGLQNGDIVHFVTSNTLPNPLSTVVDYYVINVTSSTFKVSLSEGGGEVDITTAGNGNHYYSIL